MQAQYKTPLRYGGTYHGVIFSSIVKLIHFFVSIVKSMHWWVGRRAKKKLAILTIYCIRITKSKTFYRKNKSKESLCDKDL